MMDPEDMENLVEDQQQMLQDLINKISIVSKNAIELSMVVKKMLKNLPPMEKEIDKIVKSMKGLIGDGQTEDERSE